MLGEASARAQPSRDARSSSDTAMKPLAFAALCALLSQCHSRDSSLSRPKRTLRMLESLLGTMRDTLVGPPPAAPPAAEFIFATKYPLGVKYALYPTVRMHIRPIQQHLIYMQTMPALPVLPAPASALRTVRPSPNAGGAVEMLRSIPPLVQLPKTKTTTTIHYEIIPYPLPVRLDPEAERRPQQMLSPSPPTPPLQPPLPPPSSMLAPPPSSPYHPAAPSHYEEGDDQPAPWSLDELPPPVGTSEPLNVDDETDLPWNLHALPPPVATKPPTGEEGLGWQMRPAPHDADGEYALPVFDKKFTMQRAQQHLAYFRPSPLHSEITVQPSVELAAYSHTHPLAQQPPDDEYGEPLRSLSNPKPQIFPSRNNRLRREAPVARFVEPDADRRLLQITAQPRILSSNVALTRRGFKSEGARATWPDANTGRQSKLFRQEAKGTGGRSDESEWLADADAASASAQSPQSWLPASGYHGSAVGPEPVAVERYVLITPRPANASRHSPPPYATNAAAVVAPQPLVRQQTADTQTSGSREQRQRYDDGESGVFFDRLKDRSRFPATGLLSKQPRHRLYPSRSSLLSRNKRPQSRLPLLSADGFFDDKRPAIGFGGGGSDGGGRTASIDELLRTADIDKVEYFEPIVIDVDVDADAEAEAEAEEEEEAVDEREAKRRKNGGLGTAAKVGFKFNDLELSKRSSRREPLRLPGRLHETVDRLSEALRHPPVFDDADGDGSEPRPATATLLFFGNELA